MKQFALALVFAGVFASSAHGQRLPEEVAQDQPTQTFIAHGQAMSVVAPEDWYIIYDQQTAYRIADDPDGSFIPFDATTITVMRSPVPAAQTPQAVIEEYAALLDRAGADWRAHTFGPGREGLMVRERSEAFQSTRERDITAVLYRVTMLAALEDELAVFIATFPERETQEEMLAMWAEVQLIVNSFAVLDQARGRPPIPDDAVQVESVPFDETFEMEAGKCVTLVLPDGESVSFWAMRSEPIGGPGASSGLDVSWGERPFCSPMVTDDGERYIEQGSVITRGRREKVHELYVGDLEILLTQDMEAEEGMPVVVTIREREEEAGEE